MHLVKKQETVALRSRELGGFAGWVIALVRALWLAGTMRREGKKQMSVIETLSIGGRKQLVLVSCAGEHFLVGTGADSVQTIVRVHADSGDAQSAHARGFGERP